MVIVKTVKAWQNRNSSQLRLYITSTDGRSGHYDLKTKTAHGDITSEECLEALELSRQAASKPGHLGNYYAPSSNSVASHALSPVVAVPDKAAGSAEITNAQHHTITISTAFSGHVPLRVGEIRKRDHAEQPEYLKIVSVDQPRYHRDEDYEERSRYWWTARAVAATLEESLALRTHLEQCKHNTRVRALLERTAKAIKVTENFVTAEIAAPTGKQFGLTGRDQLLANDFGVYLLEYNANDGDDWRGNTVSGQYRAWYTRDTALAAEIRALELFDTSNFQNPPAPVTPALPYAPRIGPLVISEIAQLGGGRTAPGAQVQHLKTGDLLLLANGTQMRVTNITVKGDQLELTAEDCATLKTMITLMPATRVLAVAPHQPA